MVCGGRWAARSRLCASQRSNCGASRNATPISPANCASSGCCSRAVRAVGRVIAQQHEAVQRFVVTRWIRQEVHLVAQRPLMEIEVDRGRVAAVAAEAAQIFIEASEAAIELRGHSFEAFRQLHQFETGSRRSRPPRERSQFRRRIAQFLGAALYVFIDHSRLRRRPPNNALRRHNALRVRGVPHTQSLPCHRACYNRTKGRIGRGRTPAKSARTDRAEVGRRA